MIECPMHAEVHLEYHPRHDFGNVIVQKCANFQMSECHLEQLARPPECPLSDSECLWSILGRNISEPKIIIFARNIFHHVGVVPPLVLETGLIKSRSEILYKNLFDQRWFFK